MDHDGAAIPRDLLDYLLDTSAIEHNSGGIFSTSLNPLHYPHLVPKVRRIAGLMRLHLLRSRIDFNAIASVPTGGDLYATELIQLMMKRDSRQLQRVLLRKNVELGFRLARHQSVVPGSRVLIVDDCIWHGGTSHDACAALTDAGMVVAGFAFVADINAGTKRLPRQGIFQSRYPSIAVFNDQNTAT